MKENLDEEEEKKLYLNSLIIYAFSFDIV